MKRVLVCEWPIEEMKTQADGQHVLASFAKAMADESEHSRKISTDMHAIDGEAGPFLRFPLPVGVRIEERD